MKTILIADDEDQIREMIRLMLESHGCRILTASDGRQALEIIENDKIELAIIDILMPEKDGLETIVEAKRISPETKIIAISGGGRIDAVNYLGVAGKLGADAILSKPLWQAQVSETVEELLSDSEAGA